MSFFDLLNHIINFTLPAIALGVMVPLFSRLIWRKVPVKRSLRSQMTITTLTCLAVLFAGLVVFSADGMMATYGAMVTVAAVCQWWYQGWRV
jgi:ABC-type bacteriocin/lantibiotic exporter with double-glycine peptidase domain